MAPDLFADELGSEIDAALRGLEHNLGPEAHRDVRFAATVLEKFGDAIRLGVTVPPAVRGWCRALNEDTLTSILELLNREAVGWAISVSAKGNEVDELGFDLRRRDQVESALRAVAWICLRRERLPVDLLGWRECRAAVCQYDDALTSAIDRGTAESLLGPRVRLLGKHDWTERLPEPRAEMESGGAIEMPVAPMRRPSDEAVQRYVSEGILQKLVEGCASHDPEFANEVASVIDAFRNVGECICLAARRWRRDREEQTSPRKALDVLVDKRHFAMAASDGTEPHRERKVLGLLPGVPVEATLDVDAEKITLHLFAQVRLVEVQLGSERATSPASGGPVSEWQVVTSFSRDPMKIRIVAEDGRVFEDHLQLTTE
jgi:hypothetical protein